jgi:hypothetical protein
MAWSQKGIQHNLLNKQTEDDRGHASRMILPLLKEEAEVFCLSIFYCRNRFGF